MDIRTLEYFLAIVREESITKAAKTLNMTQPPLSRQMKDLEEEIGKPLFIRESKRIVLTEEGILLRKRAEEIVSLFEKTRNELTGTTDNVIGDILIGAGEMEGISFIAKLADTLKEKHPGIHYKLYSGDAGYVMDKLDKGLIDFGLFIGQVDISKYDYINLPISERWGVIMRDDSELARFDSIKADQLLDKPLILSHQVSENSEMSHWLKNNPENLNVVMTYNLAYNASIFVRNNFGYMLALDKIVNTTIGSGLVFRPLSPEITASMSIVWKKHQVFGQAAKVFLETLKSTLYKNS